MPQRLVIAGCSPGRELHQPAAPHGVLTVPGLTELRLLPAVLTLFLLLLAPSQVRAQDRSQLHAAATVLPAGPSQDALHAALRLVRLQPVAPDTTLVSRPPLAQLRVRRSDSRADSTLVVSIDFLHN